MNLWVRSQDKENLIPIKNPICVYDNKIVYKESASYVITIGEYETKERAIEVLDEIQERTMLINTINLAKDRDSLIAYKNALTEEKIKGLGYPYQMPKD
jgi:hypothetical protein